jgi:hypothetical protein
MPIQTLFDTLALGPKEIDRLGGAIYQSSAEGIRRA